MRHTLNVEFRSDQPVCSKNIHACPNSETMDIGHWKPTRLRLSVSASKLRFPSYPINPSTSRMIDSYYHPAQLLLALSLKQERSFSTRPFPADWQEQKTFHDAPHLVHLSPYHLQLSIHSPESNLKLFAVFPCENTGGREPRFSFADP